MPNISEFLAKCVLWQIQIIKLGGPRLIQETRSVYLLGTALNIGVDAKYAKHFRVFGEMCVVADTDNKVGRTKIDPRGKISLFVGYSTQHAGDVYRLLNPKTSRVIHSRDVKWTGKTWAEFYKIKMIDRASGYVDPDEDL